MCRCRRSRGDLCCQMRNLPVTLRGHGGVPGDRRPRAAQSSSSMLSRAPCHGRHRCRLRRQPAGHQPSPAACSREHGLVHDEVEGRQRLPLDVAGSPRSKGGWPRSRGRVPARPAPTPGGQRLDALGPRWTHPPRPPVRPHYRADRAAAPTARNDPHDSDPRRPPALHGRGATWSSPAARRTIDDVWASITESQRTARWFCSWEGDATPGKVIRYGWSTKRARRAAT